MAVLSGVLQVLPFPIAGPTPLWRTAFCWIALLPLLWALLGNSKTGNPLTLRQGAVLGYLCGFVWYMGNCYWIYQTMYLYGGLAKPIAAGILVLFCLYLGLYHALFATLIAAFRKRFGSQGALLLVPFAWVAVELARARITGLPWDLLGIAQVDNPAADAPRSLHWSLRPLLHHRCSQRPLAHPHPRTRAALHSHRLSPSPESSSLSSTSSACD